MQTSIFLAQLIGPLFLVMGAGALVNRERYREMAHEFLDSRALIYVAGLLAFVPGLAIVLLHNVWAADWRVVITIFGWLGLIGGIFRIVFPQQVTDLGEKILGNVSFMIVPAIVMLLLGVWLSYYGYVA
jgi:hypothetical protein